MFKKIIFIALLLVPNYAWATTTFDDVIIEDSCTVPSLTQGDNSTHAANTAYVDLAVSNATIPDATTLIKGKVKLSGDLSGTADLPTVPGLTTKAPLISPALTGSPTAPTQTQGDNSTKISTTAYVDTAVSNATIPDATTSVKGKIKLAGDLSGTADLPTVPGLATKEPLITAGTTLQYYRGDKSFQTLNTLAVPELTNLYYTQARFDSAFTAKSTTNLSEGSNLYYTNGRVDSEFDIRLATKTTSNLSEGSNLYFTNARAQSSFSVSSPLIYSLGVIGCSTASASQAGCLSAADWNTFNAKLDASRFDDVINPGFEVNTIGWNLYNNTGRTDPAYVVDQDITYTSALSGNSGNGATITYALGISPYAEPPTVTCPTGTSVLITWYNGPTLSQNPTATVLKAAFDAQACATAIASATITGTASRRQYITGAVTLANGGDTSPVNGTGGVPAGVSLVRTTVAPLQGIASGHLIKDAISREGQGVSTDFQVDSADKGNPIQVSFAYDGSSGMVLGSSSDVTVWIYDITNAVLLPLTPLKTIAGPVSTAKTYVGKFTASATSVDYRLILHIGTASTTAWDFQFDAVVANDIINATDPLKVESVVLPSQAISGSVTDHMAVAWTDGASAWVPATSAYNGDYWSNIGFATNIVGLTADIYVRGYMDGFSFGPFAGYNQYVDPASVGNLTPLPSPFTDTYLIMGKAISSTAMNIQPFKGIDLIQTSGTPRKGGVLTNTGANDGTGDVAIAGGTTGQFLRANSGITNGLQWFTPVGTAPIVYTASTSAFSCTAASNSVAGCLSAADHTTFAAAAPLASPAFTGTPSLPTGTTGVTQSAADSTTKLATTAFVTTADNLKANLASPTFSGTPSLPTGTTGVTQSAGNSTTALATTAFVTTADNLKANLASPTFTGDVNSSTGNVLVSTIGKGLQVKTGTNAKIGQATLVGGTKTVANTSVTANSRIFLSVSTTGGTPSTLSYTKSVGTSFTITSANVLDTSTIDWMIVESIP